MQANKVMHTERWHHCLGASTQGIKKWFFGRKSVNVKNVKNVGHRMSFCESNRETAFAAAIGLYERTKSKQHADFEKKG